VPDDKERFAKVFAILEANQNKDFVKRILDPQNSPFIENEDKSVSTHRMALEVGEALGEDKDKVYVFPTILRGEEGKLVNYGDWKKAWPAAKAQGEYLEFNSFEEADWFERNWKTVWGHPPRK
jgi:hypothetical protein